MPGRDTLSFAETPLGEPAEGQILARSEYLSLDSAMCGWMNDTCSYTPPVGIDEVMRALGVGKVLVSKHPGFQTGDYVNGALGVQDYFVDEPKGFYKVDSSRAPLSCYLSALDMIGMTVYFTLLDIGQSKSGETVMISGAASMVSSVAGRIARLKGCRVVDIVGGVEKYRFLVEELGLDGAIDYKNEDLIAGLKRECPKGIDILSDNVGGGILDTTLARVALKAYIILCRAISQYSSKGVMRGPANYLSLLTNRARMEGMVVMDYAQRSLEGLKEMAAWPAGDKLQSCEDIVEGLETLSETLLKLSSGENFGKLVLKV